MLSRLHHLSVRQRVWAIVAILIGSTVLGSIIDIMILREALWREREVKTRQLVESGYGVLAYWHARQSKGELSEAAAQAAAIGSIKAMRYDEKEYFWLNDLGTPFPKMIMHPTVAALDGQLLDGEQFNCVVGSRAGTEGAFTRGNDRQNIFLAFAEVINQSGAGYVTYDWPKPQMGSGATDERYPKLSYVKKFAPWGWVIGTGVYIDDVDAAVRQQVERNVLFVGGAGIVLLFFASLMARSITQPLQRTVATMRTIGRENSGLAQRLPVEGSCEIAELAVGFNDMLGHLEARDAELARHRESLEEAVTHRTLELRSSNLQLEKELAERQHAEQALSESRVWLRALLDATDESVMLLDPEGRILAINAFAAGRFKQTPESMAGLNFFDFLPPSLAASRLSDIQHVVTSSEPMHTQDQRGTIFFDNSLYPIKNEAGVVESIAVYAKDVSEAHRTQAVEAIFSHLDTVLLKWNMNVESIAQIFCDDLLPVFDLTAAWIGRAEKDGALRVIASAEGVEPSSLAPLRASSLRWDDQPGCCLPAREVIHSGSRQIVNAGDHRCQACSKITQLHFAQTSLLLPLSLRGETWGVLGLYGRNARQFEPGHLSLYLAAISARLGVTLESAAQQEWLTLLDTALAGVGNAVFITDAKAEILWANRSFAQLSGYASEEVLGQTPKLFSSGVHDASFYQRFWQTVSSGRTWHGEIVNIRPDGTRYTISQTVTPLLNSNAQVNHYVAIVEDISERKAAEERIQHTANFDLLTDLPNRSLFFDRLGQALALARRDGLSGALLFLDLDHFKEVNDQLGHAAGDALLIAVAQRLRAQVRESDTVARLGGDEFTIILPSLRDGTDATCVADKIITAIRQPFLIAGREVTVGISIGIALFPEHGNVVELILNAADHAMYLAKKGGRNRYDLATAEAATLVESGLDQVWVNG